MSGSESDDYMSLAFVEEPLSKKQKIEKPAPTIVKSLKQGLETEIDSENKGFQMLMKMGYKKGQKLGSSYDKDAGLIEPIAVNIREGKLGLGSVGELPMDPIVDYSIDKTKDVDISYKAEPVTQSDLDSFRSLVYSRFDDRELQTTIPKLELLVQDFDEKNQIPQHPLWPIQSSELIVNSSERYTKLIEYLRGRHLYCYYCGFQYNDEQDMQECPGKYKSDH